jgi:hypothetical protein
VNRLDGLFEADGDEQADDDGGDVDEEVAPGVGGLVGRVDVEHGVLRVCGYHATSESFDKLRTKGGTGLQLAIEATDIRIA